MQKPHGTSAIQSWKLLEHDAIWCKYRIVCDHKDGGITCYVLSDLIYLHI